MSWSFVAQQRTPVHGGRDFPSVRYSAAAVEYHGELITTHGYFYNHAIRHPAWQSNAWAFNFASQRWRKIHEGEQAGAPSARYSTSAVMYDDALWMFGGDDGGHKKSMFNYIFQSWFDELWRFDLRAYTWRHIAPANQAPPKRALHSAVVIGDAMYVYGGLELADTWRYDFGPKTWTLIVPPPADTHTKDGSHPGRRHAFAAAATPGGMYIFGGCRHVRGSRPLAFNDLWYFSVGANTWHLVAPAVGAEGVALPSPAARSHLSFVPLSDSLLLLYGGALCIPGCSCYGDTWTYDTRTTRWTALNATNAPIHRYRQNVVVHAREGAVYLFGGESYQPYMYHNAVNRLELPSAIATEMVAYAGSSLRGGGGGKGIGGKRGGGHRARAASTYEGGRAAAEADDEPLLPTSASQALGAAQGAAATLSGASGRNNGMVYAPAAVLISGLVVWAVRSRRQRVRYGRYRAVET